MGIGTVVKKVTESIASTLNPKPESQPDNSKKGKMLKDPDFVRKVYALYKEYESAYSAERARIDRCELYYNNKHWDEVTKKDSNEPRPVTPSLHSAIESAQAEFIDRFPQVSILPQTKEDTAVAEIVSALIQKNHDAAHYKKEYGHLVHDLLVSGYCVQEVGYDVRANRGLGGAFIRHVDVYNIMFDPLATKDIQDSRGIFKVFPRTIESIEQEYPAYQGEISTDSTVVPRDKTITFDNTKSVMFLEYWWREFDPEMYEGVGGSRVHMAQLAGQQILGDSRIERPQGYFADGEYPFVVTYLFERKGTPLGYGMVDVHGDQQMMADKLDQQVAINAVMAGKPKLLIAESSGFDVDDLRDFSKQVHKGNSTNGVEWLVTPPLPNYLLTHIETKRQNMYETSGANDVSQGNMNAGVTSARAIASLQSASNKRTRTVSDRMMDDFKCVVNKEIEAERDFNVVTREVLIKKEGEQQRAAFDSKMLWRKTETGADVPMEFEISIKVEVENKWSTEVHNDFILRAVEAGVLTKEEGFELMIIDGKDAILAKMKETPPAPDPAQQAEQQATEQAGQQQTQLAGQLQQMQSPETVLA